MHENLTYTINGCLFKVYNTLGNIWKEAIYEKALASELRHQGLKAEQQKPFAVHYFDKRVGYYQMDLLVEETVVVELKAVPCLLPLHRAQLISYLKGFDKPLGILANFGSPSLEHVTYPNKTDQKFALADNFDFDKIRLRDKARIKDLLFMANRIRTMLGAGYFHQIYQRAFYEELKQAGIEFQRTKEVVAKYRDEELGSREVNFFLINDLLLAAVAVNQLDELTLSRFRSFISYFQMNRGLIFNFNSLQLDFRYFG